MWAMKAAWDRCEEYYDPAHKQEIKVRTKTCLELWEEHLKDTVAAMAKDLECLKTACWVWHLVSLFVVANRCRRNGFQHRWCEKCAKDVGGAQKGRRLALRGPMGCCALAHIILLLTRPEEVRAAQRALSSSSRRSLSSDRGSAVLSPVSLRRRSRLVL